MKQFIKNILPNFLLKLIKKFLYKKNDYKQLKILNSLQSNFKNTSYINTSNVLSVLCEKYGSDKGFINTDVKKPYSWTPHSYTSYYHSIFNCHELYKEADITTGDAIDDLSDIVYDLLEIKWRIQNNSLQDGLQFFELIFRCHTQQHILDLLNFMKSKNG